MQLEGYQQIQFISGPFEGLLGRTLSPVDTEGQSWYVEVMIANNPVVQEVPAQDIKPLY